MSAPNKKPQGKASSTPRTQEKKMQDEIAKLQRNVGRIPNTQTNLRLMEFDKGHGPVFPVIFGNATAETKSIVAQYVYHRPYGDNIHYDSEKDWALSKMGDVRTFFEKRKNPDFSKVEALCNDAENAHLVSAGLLLKVGKDFHYPVGGYNRRESVKKARENFRIHKSIPGAKAMNEWFCYLEPQLQVMEMKCLNSIANLYNTGGKVVDLTKNLYKYQPTLLDKTTQKIVPKLHGVEPGQLMSAVYDSLCCNVPMPQKEPTEYKYAGKLSIINLPVYTADYDFVRLSEALSNYEESSKELEELAKGDAPEEEIKTKRGELKEVTDHVKTFKGEHVPSVESKYFYPLQGTK